MKQIWKRISVLMLVVLCMFTMTACGKKEAEVFQNVTDEMVQKQCIPLMENVLQTLPNFQKEELKYLGSNENRDDFTRNLVIEWVEKTKTLGAFVKAGTPETEINHEKDQVTVRVPAEFEKSKGVIALVFNYKKDFDSMVPAYMTVTEEETFASNMKGAAINTVMGVGIVFCTLFFLIAVISLFKYVNKIGEKYEEKETPAPKKVVAPVKEETEELVDDLELVAVISAAIAASENTSTDSFVVRSIKKVNRNKWQRA